MSVFTAPEPIFPKLSVFLGGTIDDGNSTDWQDKLVERWKDLNLDIYNPRRKQWDSNATDEEVDKQIDWELEAMQKCDIIILNFLPDSKSPISLLELGLHANSLKLYVCCPPEFYRYRNVLKVCEKFGVVHTHELESLCMLIEGHVYVKTELNG